MKLSAYGILVAVGCAVSACSSADSGSGQGDGNGGFGAFPPGGGGFAAGSGGFPPGSGGFPPGSGGFPPGSGGFPPGSGGFPPGSGGFPPGSGGFPPGSGGVPPGSGGIQGSGGEGVGGAPPATKPPCITSGATQAAIIGDSYVTGAATPALQPALGAIDPSINSYKNYAVPGTSMASGGILGFIPPQLDQALAQPVKFMIMDGGGNDILICNQNMYPGCNTACKSPGARTNKGCTDIVQAATDTATTLMNKAADKGVRDVIYFFYPHLPGTNAGYSEILDYSEPLAKAKCDDAVNRTGGKLTCHFVDLVKPFEAAPAIPATIASDSIHPSDAGQKIIAKEITDLMKARCLGQPASSGCCTP